MKKWTIIFASLMLLILSVVGASKSYAGDKLMSASFDSVRVYYAMDKVTGAVASSVFNVTVITPKEVAYGNMILLRIKAIRCGLFPAWVGFSSNFGTD